LVHTFHGHTFYNYFSPLKGFIFLSIERFLGRFTDKIIVISKQQFKEICFDFKVGKEDDFEVIPIGIDLVPFQDMLQFKGLLRKEYGIGDDKIVVGAMGRITDIKNYKMLVNVSSKLKAQNPNFKVHFFIFGGGSKDDIRVLKEYIKENNVEDIFHLTGNVEKPERVLADVDIGALTSLNEGTPVFLLEAMAAGKPIISTAVGGVVDLLGGEPDVKGEDSRYDLWDRRFRVLERGILVNSKDDDGFAEGLKFLIKNKRLMALMGNNGRRFVENNYSKDRLIYDIERLYLNNV
jgi:glycosyltransferase involved in cell wall biosynthesis